MRRIHNYFFVLGLLFVSAPTMADEWNSNINFAFGYKNINDPYFDGADDHFQGGIMLDFSYTDWPVHLVLDRLRSTHTGVVTTVVTFATIRVEMTTEEYDIGVRKIWQPSQRTRPYIGGGLALLEVEYSEKLPFTDKQSDTAEGTGYWYGGGIYFTLARHFNLGLDIRHSSVDVTLLGRSVDAGGTSTSLILGIHW